MGTPPEIAACIPLVIPVTKFWSDVWVIDELAR